MKIGILGIGLVALVGCSQTLPPKQLADARSEYQKASTNPQTQNVQAEMYDAHESLKLAEQSFKDNGDTEETKSLAYIADRKIIAAEAKGSAFDSLNQKKLAEANFNQWKSQQAVAMKDQLDKTQSALSQAQRDADAARAKTAALLSQIDGLKTKQTEKGLVLSLSGSVLFETNKSTLLPAAQQRLTGVAKALKDDDKHTFDVMGFTDSTGPKDLNDRLSKQRADSVRSFLVAQGVPSDRIRSEGMGPANPVADNASPEGRADNRRVEILVENGSNGH